MNRIKLVGRAIGVDADDVRVLATVFVVVVVAGVALVVLAALLGLALWTFDLARF